MTDQTVICILAMMDTAPGRDDLLAGKATLRDGARINNILIFARNDLGRTVAENTRESYRKASLKPLQEAGIVAKYQSSINDPNTWYVLNPTFYAILSEQDESAREALIKVWNSGHSDLLATLQNAARTSRLAVTIEGTKFDLSPGKHNELIRLIVEQFAPSFIPGFVVLYLGDAESKMLFLNEHELASLGISLNKHDKLPDVILYKPATNIVYIVEAVSSVGPISESRMAEIRRLLERSKGISFGLVMGDCVS